MTMGKWPLGGFFGGRSGRGEYWLSLAGLFGLNLALGFALGDPMVVSLISLPIWLVIAARRLHDFGRSGWWGLIPFGVGFMLGFVGAFEVPISSLTQTWINAATMLVTVVAIGAISGTSGHNRFGERPGMPEGTQARQPPSV